MAQIKGDLASLQSVPRDLTKWQKAQQQLMSGRYGHALAAYRQLAATYPRVAQVWFELGIAAGGELDFAQAHEAFQTSAGLAPDDVSLLVLIGQQYQRLRQLDRARESYERAVAADPTSIHARLSLAAWFERERKLIDAQRCVEESLARHPGDAQARYFGAFLMHRRGQNAEAEAQLRELTTMAIDDAGFKCSVRHLLAVVLDELGQYAEAMRWLREAKDCLRQTTDIAALERTYDQTDRQRRQLLAELTPAILQRWRAEGTGPLPHQLVFLGGHPRSGTTLVEQILGAHPDIAAFDEPEAFVQEILNDVAPAQSARGVTLDGLNALSAASRANLRQRYFKSLLREMGGNTDARVLVDKNPSPTASLHVWLRMFPDLKVIIPLRDPRDVVISCYFQNLTLTPSNVNFLSLERTAKHFADLMDVWLRMKELGGFDWIETRYEDVVENLEREGRRVTEFVGLQWHPNQVKYYEAARSKFVFAPTYHDVTKPVHKRAVRRWEHYADALQPVMERLTPYCKAFGYE